MTGGTDPPATAEVLFRVSVGHLAEFVHRRGDLGGSSGPRVGALEGLRRQQHDQASRKDPSARRYRREVRLAGTWRSGNTMLEVAGRADGLEVDDEAVCLEEIKTFRGALDEARQRAGSVHDAQVRLYGALFTRDPAVLGGDAVGTLTAVRLRLVYLDADTDRREVLEWTETADALGDFFAATCADYAQWLEQEVAWRLQRDGSLADLAFPLPAFRPGQRGLARAVWRALRDRRPLLAEAPTGIGKTLAVLYAAVRRLSAGDTERLVYLTARGPGRRAALGAVGQLTGAGARLRTVELLAREKMCLQPDAPCTGSGCAYARGYYDRRRPALRELLGRAADGQPPVLDASHVRETGRAHGICPAQLQHDAARFCDVVIGDFNYGFDPLARQRALLDPEEGGAAVLVDEAHHLAERAREMYSAELDPVALRRTLAEARLAGCAWAEELDRLLRALRRLGVAPGGREIGRLVERAERLAAAISAWLATAPPGRAVPEARQVLGALARFLDAAAALRGAHGSAWRVLRGEGDGTLRLRCLAPGARLAEDCRPLHGLVLFSATLSPPTLIGRVLGLAEETTSLRLPSPFPPARRGVLITSDLDLRLRRRESALPALTTLVAELVRARPGHHLVFVPAFSFLERLRESLASALPEAELLVQAPGMDEAARTGWLERLARPDGRTRVALAIAGGLFGEGIDLPGDALVGVVVAGLPLPAPDVEREAVADYHGEDGFELAYRLPALTRVLQAAGRLIRTETDAGLVCLADRRLAAPAYRRLLPPEWQPEVLPVRGIAARARRFWAELS